MIRIISVLLLLLTQSPAIAGVIPMGPTTGDVDLGGVTARIFISATTGILNGPNRIFKGGSATYTGMLSGLIQTDASAGNTTTFTLLSSVKDEDFFPPIDDQSVFDSGIDDPLASPFGRFGMMVSVTTPTPAVLVPGTSPLSSILPWTKSFEFILQNIGGDICGTINGELRCSGESIAEMYMEVFVDQFNTPFNKKLGQFGPNQIICDCVNPTSGDIKEKFASVLEPNILILFGLGFMSFYFSSYKRNKNYD